MKILLRFHVTDLDAWQEAIRLCEARPRAEIMRLIEGQNEWLIIVEWGAS